MPLGTHKSAARTEVALLGWRWNPGQAGHCREAVPMALPERLELRKVPRHPLGCGKKSRLFAELASALTLTWPLWALTSPELGIPSEETSIFCSILCPSSRCLLQELWSSTAFPTVAGASDHLKSAGIYKNRRFSAVSIHLFPNFLRFTFKQIQTTSDSAMSHNGQKAKLQQN